MKIHFEKKCHRVLNNFSNPDPRRRRRATTATGDDAGAVPLSEDLPQRALSPGRSMGLSVMLNVKEDEYYCSGTESVGFKVQGNTTGCSPGFVDINAKVAFCIRSICQN